MSSDSEGDIDRLLSVDGEFMHPELLVCHMLDEKGNSMFFEVML